MNKISPSRIAFVLIVSLFLFQSSAFAQRATIALSDSSAEFGYGMLVGSTEYGRTEFGIDFLYNDDDAYMGNVSLQVFDEVGSKSYGLEAGVGGKLYGVSHDEAEALSLGIGGMLRYALPINTRIVLGLDGYYAPSIVSFFDAQWFYEVGARAAFKILPKASIFFEYRDFAMEVENESNKDVTAHVDKTYRLGLEVLF